MEERRDKEFVDGLARGLSVIEAFDPEQPEMTLSEVARKTGCTPAAARRSIFTLVTLGYMRRIDRHFMLTPKILMLGSAYFRAAHIEDALVPELRAFVDAHGDAASVGVLNGRDVLYVAHQSSGTGLRPVAGTGITYPAHATSMGRVLLATGAADVLADYLTLPLKAMTDQTVVDPAAFEAMIRQVGTDDYATAVDQLAYGVTSIAVPIRLASGEVVAAVNSSGYTGRLTPEWLVANRLTPLRATAERLSAILLQYPTLVQSLRRAG